MPLFKVNQGDLLILGLFPRQWSPPWSLVKGHATLRDFLKSGREEDYVTVVTSLFRRYFIVISSLRYCTSAIPGFTNNALNCVKKLLSVTAFRIHS